MTAERAFLFIDGSNLYHAARDIGIATGDLDYTALAHKLILDRRLAGIRYYVGKVSGDVSRIASQPPTFSPRTAISFRRSMSSNPGARRCSRPHRPSAASSGKRSIRSSR